MRTSFVVFCLVFLATLWGFALTVSAADGGKSAPQSADGAQVSVEEARAFCSRQERVCFKVCSVFMHNEANVCRIDCRKGLANCAETGCFDWPANYVRVALREGGQQCIR